MNFKQLLIIIFSPLVLCGQQTQFRSIRVKEGLSNNYVNDIAQDKTGYIWVGTRMGLNRYNGAQVKNYFNDSSDSTSLPFNSILSLFVAEDNTLWVGAYGSKVASYDLRTELFTSYPFEDNEESKDLDVFDIFSDEAGSVCLSTRLGVYSLQGGIFEKDQNAKNMQARRRDSLDTGDGIWLATNSGLRCISKSGNATTFSTENTPELQTNAFQSVFRDKDGNLWFGTHGGGLVQMRHQKETLQYLSGKNIPLRNPIISNFFKDDAGKLWVATDGGGISVFDEHFNILKQIDAPGYPKSNSVLEFALDEDGWLWAAGWETGVFAIRTDNYQVKSFLRNFEKRGISNKVKSVAIKGDTVYCGTYGDGVVLINRKTGDIVSHHIDPKRSSLKSQLLINDIFIDSEGDIWIGSTRGLYEYRNNVMQYFPTDTTDPYNTDKKMIWSLCEGDNTDLLLTTVAGAYRLDKKMGRISKMDFGVKTDFNLKFTFRDDRNHYWLGASDNLSMVNDDSSFVSIKLSQADRSIDIFNPGAIYQDPQSYLYVGTQDGFYRFHPDSIDSDAKAPEIIFETFKIKYADVKPGKTTNLKDHINETSQIELNYDDFPISFSFASIDYNPQTAIKFAYKLLGIDSTWMTIEGNKELIFHNLTPGQYTLQLRNTNKYGKWSEEMRELRISIEPPYWQQWWFRLVILALILSSLLVIYRARVRRMRDRQIELIREVDRKTLALQTQNKEIREQKEKLEIQADVLQEKLLELHDQKEELGILNTELSEQSAELSSLNKQLTNVISSKNKLLSIIAHDVKNPFTSILLAAQQLVDSNKTVASKETKKHSEFILSASKNVHSILSNLLDWAMSQSGLLSYSPVNINIGELLQSVGDNNKIFAAQKNIHIAVSCENDLWCYADEQMMRVVVRNLIQNSVKFTNDGGTISIRCADDGAMVHIEIVDTGIGMDEVTIKNLFEVNSLVSDRGTSDEEGHGLGLLVVKEFIVRNNGHIEVKSKKNKGSNFIITLPKALSGKMSKPEKHIAENVVLNKRNSKNNTSTIVVVEDNDKLREQLASGLSSYFEVIACKNATEAIEECKKSTVHLMVSDIVMGDIDGISLCKTIKNELGLNIPIILITGVDDPDVQTNAYNNGADAFIRKPFEFTLLLARIQNLLSSQKDHWNKGFELIKKLKPQDEIFLENLKKEVELGIPDPEFSVESLALKLGTSRTNLFRKTKSCVGLSPNDFIRYARLDVAAKLLKEKKYRITEVAYMVGFSDAQYFSNSFSKRYGMSPSDYKCKH